MKIIENNIILYIYLFFLCSCSFSLKIPGLNKYKYYINKNIIVDVVSLKEIIDKFYKNQIDETLIKEFSIHLKNTFNIRNNKLC